MIGDGQHRGNLNFVDSEESVKLLMMGLSRFLKEMQQSKLYLARNLKKGLEQVQLFLTRDTASQVITNFNDSLQKAAKIIVFGEICILSTCRHSESSCNSVVERKSMYHSHKMYLRQTFLKFIS